MFSVYRKLSQTEKASVNKEEFRLKWDLMWQKPFIYFFESQVYFNTIWVHTFLKLFFGASLPILICLGHMVTYPTNQKTLEKYLN